MDWLLSLLPPPLYYTSVLCFLLSCLYLFSSDAFRLLDKLVERRLELLSPTASAGELEPADAVEVADFAFSAQPALASLTRALSDPTKGSTFEPEQDAGFAVAYLGKGGKWKDGRVRCTPELRAVVLWRSEAGNPPEQRNARKTILLESLQRISLDEEEDNSDTVIMTLQPAGAAAPLTLRATNASEAGSWLKRLLEELVRARPQLAARRPSVPEEQVTEKLKLVCETDVPSFSVDLLALLLREFGVFAKRTDLKTHLQRTTSKGKVETYRETVEAVKEIMGQLDGPEIFQRYAKLQQSSGDTLMTVVEFHQFVTGSQGMQCSLPETLRLLRSLATSDTDLLDLLLVTRRVFRSAMISKLFSMPLKTELVELRQPLNLPLTDYFTSTSHNTYLMEDQLKGRSDCLAYEIALKKNCRCVELDIHNGPNNDPIITHGGTMTSRIRFEEVIKTIRRFAFVASDYPLILSFENHCSLDQQDRMAQILNTHLKEYLYVNDASDYMDRLPSPEDLKRKIIIKNKKTQPDIVGFASAGQAVDADESSDDESDAEIQVVQATSRQSFTEQPVPAQINEEEAGTQSEVPQSSPPMDGPLNLNRRSSSDKMVREGPPAIGNKKGSKKLKVSRSLSDLVSICRPVKFMGQKFARENYRPVEMSSLAEGKMEKKQWVKRDGEDANKLVLHTQYQLVRVYPSGLRTNSSNYNPVTAWRFGCQLVALNYQTRCENMEINDGLFQLNGGCGYVPKPAILTDPATKFNPFSPSPDLARNLQLEIVSGTNLRLGGGKEKEAEEKGLGPYVKVTLFGVPGDEKKDQTKKADQGFNPRWNYRCFEENSLVKVPDLAHLRLETKDKNSGKVIGQFSAPLTAFNKGYRRVFLKDSKDMPTPSELWIKIKLLVP